MQVFACFADIYNSTGCSEVALKVWDVAIDKKKNNPRAYVDRAKVKKALGDLEGYENDIKLAKEFLPSIDVESSIIDETLNTRLLDLRVIKIRDKLN